MASRAGGKTSEKGINVGKTVDRGKAVDRGKGNVGDIDKGIERGKGVINGKAIDQDKKIDNDRGIEKGKGIDRGGEKPNRQSGIPSFRSSIGGASSTNSAGVTPSESISNIVSFPNAQSPKTNKGSRGLGGIPEIHENSPSIQDDFSAKENSLGASTLVSNHTQLKVPVDTRMKRWAGHCSDKWHRELWDETGDTVVFLPTNDQSIPTQPAFRLSSQLIFDCKSKFLNNLLMPLYPSSDDASQYEEGGRREIVVKDSYGQAYRSVFPAAVNSSRELQLDESHRFTIYMPLPERGMFTDDTFLDYKTMMRNFFSLLLGKSVTGRSLSQALPWLLSLMGEYVGDNSDNNHQIWAWMDHIGIQDVRSDPGTACDLLNACGQLYWVEGWKEAFVHCVGMSSRLWRSYQIATLPGNFKLMLETATFHTMYRMSIAEQYLKSFNFSDMLSAPLSPLSQSCAESLRMFFVRFYTEKFGMWPLKKPLGQDFWLTRSMIREMQTDFGTLYNYLVEYDVVWGSKGNEELVDFNARPNFDADGRIASFAAVLLNIDEKLQLPHIPMPFCHVPPSRLLDLPQDAPHQLQQSAASMVYRKASNIDFPDSSLAAAFHDYESSLNPSQVNPQCARLGHWAQIYATLQVLGTVSVDTPGLKFTDGVEYPLCCRLQDGADFFQPFSGSPIEYEPGNAQTDSFCWNFAVEMGRYERPQPPESPWGEWSPAWTPTWDEIDQSGPRKAAGTVVSAFQPSSTGNNPESTVECSNVSSLGSLRASSPIVSGERAFSPSVSGERAPSRNSTSRYSIDHKLASAMEYMLKSREAFEGQRALPPKPKGLKKSSTKQNLLNVAIPPRNSSLTPSSSRQTSTSLTSVKEELDPSAEANGEDMNSPEFLRLSNRGPPRTERLTSPPGVSRSKSTAGHMSYLARAQAGPSEEVQSLLRPSSPELSQPDPYQPGPPQQQTSHTGGPRKRAVDIIEASKMIKAEIKAEEERATKQAMYNALPARVKLGHKISGFFGGHRHSGENSQDEHTKNKKPNKEKK